MREIIQLVVSFTGSLGFAALFNIHGKKLWFAALGGCLSWAVYLAVEFITPSPYACGFWSTVAITLYAECMARIHKTPVTVFLVSATIPLIPGAALYRTMNWMLMKDWAKFQKDGIYTILFAVSMAAGMTLTTLRSGWRGGGCTGKGECNTVSKFPVYKPSEMCYDFPIWKTHGRREYMCTPYYREIPGGLFRCRL